LSAAVLIDSVRGFTMLKPGDLDRVLSEHKAFLGGARNGKRATLQSCFLGQADLSNCLLSKADLSGAVLTASSLKFSNFSNATPARM